MDMLGVSVPILDPLESSSSSLQYTPLPKRTRQARAPVPRTPADSIATPSKPQCQVADCTMRALYGLRSGQESSATPVFCKAHKTEGMVSSVHRLCMSPGCTHRPNFTSSPNSREPQFCKTHKGKDDYYIEGKRCRGATPPPIDSSSLAPDVSTVCNVLPSFNFPNIKTPLFCKKHKLEGMIDVLNPRCADASGCLRRRTFNYPGSKPMFCKKHADERMVNVRNQKSLNATATPGTPTCLLYTSPSPRD